eukprot:1149810-Pelagomonas_calceolata.AAC.2
MHAAMHAAMHTAMHAAMQTECSQQCTQQGMQQCCAYGAFTLAHASWHAPVVSWALCLLQLNGIMTGAFRQ